MVVPKSVFKSKMFSVSGFTCYYVKMKAKKKKPKQNKTKHGF